MQTTWLPSTTCKRLDQINRNFLWGAFDNNRKLPLVRWDKVTKSKENGGLAIRETRNNNIALLGKMVWQLLSKKKCLWVEVFSAKYGDVSSSTSRTRDSPHWKALKRTYDILQQSFKWRVGTGTEINLWNHRWLDENPLSIHLTGSIETHQQGWKVSNIIDESGNWNLTEICRYLPSEIVQRIRDIPLDPSRRVQDRIYWDAAPNGEYTTKSAYWSLCRDEQSLGLDDNWKWIWKLPTIQSMKMMVWILMHDSLPTKSFLASRHIPVDPTCTICGRDQETILHAIRDCEMAAAFWQKFRPTCLPDLPNCSTKEWVLHNLRTLGERENKGYKWRDWFLAGIRLQWKQRNRITHDTDGWTEEFMFQQVRQLAMEFHSVDTMILNFRMSGSWVGWTKPPFGWVKLNIDGSYTEDNNSMAVGGLLRDAQGEWVTGFTNKLGRGSAIQAELTAIRDGLSLVWVLGFRKVQAESDCLEAVEMMTCMEFQNHPHAVLGYEIKELLSRNWECTFKHIYREANKVADTLAVTSQLDDRGEKWLFAAPSTISQALVDDMNGVLFHRE
ncbi:Putative ribonuclease H protein At1g65750 [Linum perenne]